MLYNKQFKWQDDLIHNVGLTFFKKDWVIKEIAYHPLKFAKRRMEDPTDDRPIRIRYFAAFALKSSKTKERVTKFKEIFRNYSKYGPIMKEMGYEFNTEEEYRYIVQGIAIKYIYKIDAIYDKGLVVNESQDLL
jgi:hypothetical protein